MCAQECGHWADAKKEERMEGCYRKRKTEVEAETEGQQLLSGRAAALESHDRVCPRSCSETTNFNADTRLGA